VKTLARAMAAVLALLLVAPAFAADAAGIRFEVRTQSGAGRHAWLLDYPPYLAAALENAGVRPSNAARVRFVDSRALWFRNAELRFESAEGGLHKYRVRMKWNVGVADIDYDINVLVDARQLAQDRVELVIQQSGTSLLPTALVDLIGLKIQSLAGPEAQAAVMRYLDGLPGGPDNAVRRERILIDSYNLPGAAGGSCNREPGDAERLQDMVYFFATRLSWMIAVPALFFWARRRRARRMAGR
jgi:hypothetical protein